MYYTKIKKYISSLDFINAETLLTKYYKDTSNIKILFSFGLVYFQLKKYGLAKKYFNIIISSENNSILILKSIYYIILIYIEEKDIKAILENICVNINIKFNSTQKTTLYKQLETLLNEKKDYKILVKYYLYLCKVNYKKSKFIRNILNIIYKRIIDLCINYNYNLQLSKTIEIYNFLKKHKIPKIKNVFLDNKLLSVYEFATQKIILKSKPTDIFICLSNLCNLKCIMCGQKKYFKKIYPLNKQILDVVIKNLKFVEKIVWAGGEITLLPYLTEIFFKTMKYKNLQQIIITNFQDISDELLRLFVVLNINLIISIDAPTKYLYEKIRVGGSFDRLINNLNRLNEFVACNQKTKLTKTLTVTIMKINYYTIAEMIDFANRYKFPNITFSFYIGNDENLKLSFDELNIIYSKYPEYKKLAKKYNINITLNIDNIKMLKVKDNLKNVHVDYDNFLVFSDEQKQKTTCIKPWEKLTVDIANSLSIHPICKIREYLDKDYKVSNIYTLWNHSILQKIRSSIVNKRFNDTCSYKCPNIIKTF